MKTLKNNFQLDDFDIRAISRKILKYLWAILCSSGIVAMLAMLVILYFYHPEYKQTVNFYVEYGTQDTTKFLTYLEDTNTIASSITNIINTQLTHQKLNGQLGEDTSISTATKIIGYTNLFSVTLSSKSAEKTYQASKALIEIIPQIVEELYGDAPVVVHNIPQDNLPKSTLSFTKEIIVSIMSGILTACLFILLIIISEFYRNTVKHSGQCERKLGESALVTIPHEKKSKKKSTNSSLYRKSFYSLANNLISQKEKDKCKKILFANVKNNEEDAAVLSYTAISLAELGYRVAVIDLNLRNPQLCNFFDVDSQNLNDIIKGTTTTFSFLHPIEKFENLVLIGNSASRDSSINSINSDNLKEYLEKLSQNFDFILFNTMSASVWSDARNIGMYADEFLLIVKRNVSNVNGILETRDTLTKAGLNFDGFIFNDAYNTQILKEDAITKLFIGRSTYEITRA